MTFSTDFPRLFSPPCCTGAIRVHAEDFQVDEHLGVPLSGEGEHLYVQIRKRHQNTQWIAKQLANVADIRPQDVAYAGLKDRHAVTTQWFSLWLPGKADPTWEHLENDDIQVLQQSRHSRKLKRGGHDSNQFTIRIRGLQVTGDLEQRLQEIRARGVPNYFGEQRFGRENGNLVGAEQWFGQGIKVKNRQQKSFYLSAARSYLFNLQVAERIRQGVLEQYLPGDVLIENNRSQLVPVVSIPETASALTALDIHATALLPGRGRTLVTDQALALEEGVLEDFPHWVAGLEKNGLANERRATRIALKTLNWQLDSDQMLLEFTLPVGCFATSVLREICDYTDSAQDAISANE